MKCRSVLFLALALALTHAHAAIPEGADIALLEVHLNGKNTRETGVMWKDGSALIAEPAEWTRIGIILTKAEQRRDHISTVELGITFKIDDATQSVEMTVPASRRPKQRIGAMERQLSTPSPVAPGVIVNYNIAGTHSSSFSGVSVAHEVRTAGKWGVLSTSGQVNWDSRSGSRIVRGQTYWQFDDQKRLITYQAGDIYASGAQLGGVRIAKDPAALDPLHPTFPLPALGGIALDPGQVRVLANGKEVSQQDVDAGPFTLEGLPIPSGRSSTDLVVRDKFGRETVIAGQSLYFSPRVLRKGLTTWELAAGKVRIGEKYGEAGATASFERGMSDTWTLSGSVQASKAGHNATLGSRVVAGRAGVLSAAISQSSSEQGSGSRASVGWDYQGPRMGVSAYHEQSKNYWEISQLNPHFRSVVEETKLSLTYRSPSGALSGRLGYTDMTTTENRFQFADAQVSYRKGNHSAQVRALYDFERKATTFELGYRYSFERGSIAATVRQAPQFTQTRITGQVVGITKQGDYYQLTGDYLTDDQGNRRATVRGSLNTYTGTATAELSSSNGSRSVAANYSGALHIGAGGVSRMRTVSDGYAVVRISGVAGIPVKVNNVVVGMTDKNGVLVVGQLASLVGNKISIDDRALPMEVSLESSEALAAPKRRSGALIEFPVNGLNARIFIVQKDGKLIEAGSEAKSDSEEAIVGFDGELFLEKPKAGQLITITSKQGVCKAQLPDELPKFEEPTAIHCKR